MAKKTKKVDVTSEDFLVAFGQSSFHRSCNWREEEIVPQWEINNDLYNSKFSEKEKEQSDVLLGQGRLFIPKTYTHTQRMLVDILETFFFDHEEIVHVGSWKTVYPGTKEIVKALLNYRLNSHPIDFYQEAHEAVLDSLKNGIGIFKVYPEFVGSTEKRKGSFRPKINARPYEDVFFDPRATWKDWHQYTVIDRMYKAVDYLKRQGYDNLDQLDTEAAIGSSDPIKAQRVESTGSPFTEKIPVDGAGHTYVYEVWTHLDVDGDGYLESCSYLMAGDEGGPKILIRGVEENTLPYQVEDEEYNRPPFAVGVPFPESHQLYGKSLPQIVEALQRESNAIRNQDREATALALRAPTLVGRHANVDLMSLVNRRIGGVVLGDDISEQSIREMNVSNPAGMTQYAEARNDQNFYEATSIPPDLLGSSAQSDDTATAVTSRVANANKKIALAIKNLANTLFIPTYKMLLRLEQEYETDEFIELVTGRVLGWQFSQDSAPPKAVIQGDFELTAEIGINKQMQINKLMLLMDRGNMVNQVTQQLVATGTVDPSTVHYVNTMEIYHDIQKLMGEKDVNKYMIGATPPPVEGGDAPGIASQTSQSSAGNEQFGANNIEALGGLSIV